MLLTGGEVDVALLVLHTTLVHLVICGIGVRPVGTCGPALDVTRVVRAHVGVDLVGLTQLVVQLTA